MFALRLIRTVIKFCNIFRKFLAENDELQNNDMERRSSLKFTIMNIDGVYSTNHYSFTLNLYGLGNLGLNIAFLHSTVPAGLVQQWDKGQKHINQNRLLCQVPGNVQKRQKSDLYEPDYLITMQPDEPIYDYLNIQLKGYDFAVLESCQSQIHRYAEVMGLQVAESWANPAQQLKVQRFKPQSTVLDAEYNLHIYERNVQVTEVPAWAVGTLLRVSQALVPQGCTMTVHEHQPEHEEVRYVPDNKLIDLKNQLEDMGGSRADNKKRRK